MNFQTNTPKTPRAPLRGDLQIKYDRARANLLVVVIFTALNLFLATFADLYFLFSASIPMFIPVIFSLVGQELSMEMGAEFPPELTTALLVVGLAIGLLLTVPYLLCWIFSKKRVGWMIAALVFFSFDCLFLLTSFDFSMIMDILIHAWVMFYLITGVINGFKLKNMPESEETPLPELSEESPAEDPFNTFEQADFGYDTEIGTQNSTEDKAEDHVAKSDKE